MLLKDLISKNKILSDLLKNIPDNSKVIGYPAKDIREFLKDNIKK